MQLVEGKYGSSDLTQNESHDHLRLTTILTDHDIPEHDAQYPLLVESSFRGVTRQDRQLTAFVLSGGGSLGAVQVGMLRALLEAKIRPDLVVGTSIGALNGAFLAGHLDLDGIAEMEKLWRSIRRRDVFRISPLHLVRGTLGSQNHLFSQLGLRSLLDRADLGFSLLEDAPVPIHVVATDVLSGEAVVLSKGDTIEALVASAAIPGVFSPVDVEGRMLIDGGVVANVPIRQALELGATRVFVLPAIFGGLTAEPNSALDMMQHSTLITSAALARSDLERSTPFDDVHVMPLPDYAAPSMFNFDETSALMENAYASSATWLRAQADHIHLRKQLRVAESTPYALPDLERGSAHHSAISWSREARSHHPQTVA